MRDTVYDMAYALRPYIAEVMNERRRPPVLSVLVINRIFEGVVLPHYATLSLHQLDKLSMILNSLFYFLFIFNLLLFIYLFIFE